MSHKRTKSHTQTNNERCKTKTVTAGEGLASIAESMQVAMESLADSITGVSRGSEKGGSEAAAVAAIEKDEGLSEDELTEAVEMLMSDSKKAMMYLALNNPKA